VLGSIAIIGGTLFVDVDVLRQAPSGLSLWLALAASVAVLLVGDFVADRAISGIGIAGLAGAVAEIVHSTVVDRSTAVALVALGTVALVSCVLLARAFSHAAPTRPPEPPVCRPGRRPSLGAARSGWPGPRPRSPPGSHLPARTPARSPTPHRALARRSCRPSRVVSSSRVAGPAGPRRQPRRSAPRRGGPSRPTPG